MSEKLLKIHMKELKKIQRQNNFMPSFWDFIMLCLATGVDVVLDYIVTDVLFTQAMWLSIFTAIMVALSMNEMPLAMGAIYKKTNKTKIDKILFKVCLGIFIVFTMTMSIIRFDSMEEIFSNGSSVALSSSYVTTVETEFEASLSQIAMMFTCTLITIATSVFLFIIKVYKSTPVKTKETIDKFTLASEFLKSKNNINLQELENDKQTDRDELENIRAQEEIGKTRAIQERMNTSAKIELAKKLGDANSANKILE